MNNVDISGSEIENPPIANCRANTRKNIFANGSERFREKAQVENGFEIEL